MKNTVREIHIGIVNIYIYTHTHTHRRTYHIIYNVYIVFT